MERRGWKEFIGFSRSERSGVLALIALCLCSALFERIAPALVSQREIREFEMQYADLLAELRQRDEVSNGRTTAHDLSPGGNLQVATHSFQDENKPVSDARPPVPERLDINTADAPAMIRTALLPPEISYRVVRYRERLGGFHRREQLLEVYGVTDTLFAAIKDRLDLGEGSLKKINVNTLSAEVLQEHPYIHAGLARQMVNFREKVAPYHAEEDLSRLYFMTDSLLERLLPYIEF